MEDLFQSTSGGAAETFTSRNLGLAITEFSHLAQRADTDAVVFAGAQDNGTPRIWGSRRHWKPPAVTAAEWSTIPTAPIASCGNTCTAYST